MQPTFTRPPNDVVENATRGHILSSKKKILKTADGQTVWDFGQFEFLEATECPDTVSPMLWWQAKLCVPNGLFLVTEGIYQVRGLDASNMAIVEGLEGIIVIDALMSTETAAEGLELYRRHRGDRKVTGLIYTHPHADHYGGSRGVVSAGQDHVPVLAPEGFMEHAVKENVMIGAAMGRRSAYQFGARLPRGAHGHVGCGTCLGNSTGTRSLVPPNRTITSTGQTETIDGVRFVFQLTRGTEAPVEVNFLIPERRALCMSETVSQSMHNLTPLRGSLVRDAHAWSQYLDEAIALFIGDSDVCFGGHNWPTWGSEQIRSFLSQQRDLYAYLHDQTIRLMNQGYNGIETAEIFRLPVGLQKAWHAQEFYGSLSHNIKTIYHQYMGWYDGNPAHLWEHPPCQLAERYIECMGGVRAAMEKAKEFIGEGDLRFAATLLNHVVFSEPRNTESRELLATVYERLAWNSMCAPWRDSYLMGALELRTGAPKSVPEQRIDPVLSVATVDQIISTLSVRIDGCLAERRLLSVDLEVMDCGERHRLILSNGALTHRNVTEIRNGKQKTASKNISGSSRSPWLAWASPASLGLRNEDNAGEMTSKDNKAILDLVRGVDESLMKQLFLAYESQTMYIPSCLCCSLELVHRDVGSSTASLPNRWRLDYFERNFSIVIAPASAMQGVNRAACVNCSFEVALGTLKRNGMLRTTSVTLRALNPPMPTC